MVQCKASDARAPIVRDCTDGVPDATGAKSDWHERKRTYLEHLRSARADTLLVSARDKLHNARAIVADLRAGLDVFRGHCLLHLSHGPEKRSWPSPAQLL